MPASGSWKFPRHLLAIFLVLSLGILLTGFFYYEKQRSLLKQEKQQDLAAIADLKIKQIYNWRQDRLADAKLIMEDHFFAQRVKDWLAGKVIPDLKEEILQRLEPLKFYQYQSVMLIDGQGEVRLAVSEGEESLAPLGKSMAREAMQEKRIVFSDLHFGEASQIRFSLFVPLLARQGGEKVPVGVILLRIDPNKFLYPLIQSWPTPSPTAETLLFRQEEDKIVFLNELRHRKNTALSLHLSVKYPKLLAAAAIRKERGIIERVDYRGVPVLGAVGQIPVTPWFLAAKIDASEVYEPLRERAYIVTVLLIALIAGAGVSVALIWRHQRARFYRLQYETERERTALAQRYEYLTRYANDIILVTDPDLKIVEANEQAAASYGYSRDELLRLHLRDLHPPDVHAVLDAMVHFLEKGEGFVFETKHRRQNGTVFPVEISSRLMEVDGQKLYQKIIRDITERKHSEAALRESEERFRVLFETAGAIIALVSPDGRILQFNQQAEAITNWPRQEVLGKDAFEMFAPSEVRDFAKAEVGKALAGKRVRNLEIPIWLRDKTQRLFLWNINPVLADQGQILGAIVVGQDITQRKEAENRLMAERQRLFSLLAELPGVVSLLAPNYKFSFVNRLFRERFGDPEGKFCYEILYGRPEPCERCPMPRVLAGKEINDFEWTYPASHVYQYFLYPFADNDGSPLMLELGIDITARKQAEELVRRRANQQAAAAELGQMAIAGADLSALMNQAVTLVSESLAVEYSKVLELLPTGNALRLRAGVGWKEGLVGQAVVDAGLDSQAGYTLASASPIAVEDLRRERRFSGSPLLHEHGVVSGLSVIIHGKTRPFGVIGAHTKRIGLQPGQHPFSPGHRQRARRGYRAKTGGRRAA